MTYLGYLRRNGDSTLAHLQKRVDKAGKASLTTQSILKRLTHLPCYRKIHIANACIRSVFLYGTEACCDEDLEELKSVMNKTMRRLARSIMRTSHAAANQTLQLDLGWMSLKSEIQLRRMKLALKCLTDTRNGSIVQTVLHEAMRTGTQWTDEVNENISDAIHGRWLGNITP